MFDLVIANPPYSMAPEICNNIKEIPGVYLMPFSKFKKFELYKYVEKVKLGDRFYFGEKGQDILPNLLVAKTSFKKDSREITELEKQIWKPEFCEYYLKNLNTPTTLKQFAYVPKDCNFVKENLPRILFIPFWSYVGTAQSEKSITKGANLRDVEKLEKILKSNNCYKYILCESEVERNNLLEFWKTPLCNELIRNNSTRTTLEKLPHLDWTRSWSEEEVLRYFEIPV